MGTRDWPTVYVTKISEFASKWGSDFLCCLFSAKTKKPATDAKKLEMKSSFFNSSNNFFVCRVGVTEKPDKQQSLLLIWRWQQPHWDEALFFCLNASH